jgi:tetratricopeptide (TPR) repeat protein
MKLLYRCGLVTSAAMAVFFLLDAADSSRVNEDRLWHYRNLGKAFYENPTTQAQAVEEFRKALEIVPGSPREIINYGIALLRAGKTKEGIAALEKAQKLDPKIPHTWFNLGIAFKKDQQYDRAIQQFQQMIRLVPDEPKSHYNLAVVYKLTGKNDAALQEFQTASRLDPNLAGPHFQLYNVYRQGAQAAEAARELKDFQDIKKRTAGAVIPEDMEWSFFAEIYDPIEAHAEEAPPAELKLVDDKLDGSFDPETAGMAVMDIDGDHRPDIIAWSSRGIALYQNGSAPVSNSGLEQIRDVVGIAPADINNDGLADLCVITRSGAALYANQKGRFEKLGITLPPGRYSQAIWMDYDHDYDLDLFMLGEKSILLRNNGEAGFSNVTESFPFVPGNALAGTELDLIADTNFTDLVVSYHDRPGVLYRDKLVGKFEAAPLEALPAGTRSLLAYDVNNDSWTDLAGNGLLLLNRTGTLQKADFTPKRGPVAFADFNNRGFSDLIAAPVVYRNTGLARFQELNGAAVPDAVALAEGDFDGDGRTDLVAIAKDGSIHLLKNETASHNNWIGVQLVGIKNPKLAPDSEVELKVGSSYQKKIYRGVPLVFGLQGYKQADSVRITWTNGLIQNEAQQAVNKVQRYEEAQRLSGSCPMIFTWNGKNFEFITDVLGVAPLGASSGNGYFPVDHDEYIQIPGESLAESNGNYEIRITEELREVSYLDQVRLTALDHPAGVEVFTNDKFKSPPFPEFRLFGVSHRTYPIAARDQRGSDVLERVTRRDRTYPDSFQRDYTGVAELHHLDLDFGKAAPDGRAVLILNGWVDWADGSTFLNASQSKQGGLVLPYLQVKDNEGRWQTVIDDMGIPAGKPKTIAVDLSGKFMSASREVRIVTNLCVYWDEVFLSEETFAPHVRATELAPASADLHFRGFSKPVIHARRKQPEAFEYSSWMPVSMWNPTPGNYTRYGDVRGIISGVDDKLVIMGSGDEVTLRFAARSLPPVPAGWKRDFLLLVDGWAKDADPNTAFSQTVEPLPFHGMSGYPYPAGERYPDDPEHRTYLKIYNTRPALRLIRPLATEQLAAR